MPSIKGRMNSNRGIGWLSVTKYALPQTGLTRDQVLRREDLGVDEAVHVDVVVEGTWGNRSSRHQASLGDLLEHPVHHDVVAGTVNAVRPKRCGQQAVFSVGVECELLAGDFRLRVEAAHVVGVGCALVHLDVHFRVEADVDRAGVDETRDAVGHGCANQVLHAADVRVVGGLAVPLRRSLAAEKRKVGCCVKQGVDSLYRLPSCGRHLRLRLERSRDSGARARGVCCG